MGLTCPPESRLAFGYFPLWALGKENKSILMPDPIFCDPHSLLFTQDSGLPLEVIILNGIDWQKEERQALGLP